MINHHKLSGLKQLKLMLSQVWKQEVHIQNIDGVMLTLKAPDEKSCPLHLLMQQVFLSLGLPGANLCLVFTSQASCLASHPCFSHRDASSQIIQGDPIPRSGAPLHAKTPLPNKVKCTDSRTRTGIRTWTNLFRGRNKMQATARHHKVSFS